MMWTILNAKGEVLYACFMSDVHPSSKGSGWAWRKGQRAVEIDHAPDPAKHEWNGKEWAESLVAEQARAWEQVKALRADREAAGIDTPFGRVDSDAESRGKISRYATTAMLRQQRGEDFSVEFTMADNTVKKLDADAMIEVALAVSEHDNRVHAASQRLREKIRNAKSAKSVRALKLTAE